MVSGHWVTKVQPRYLQLPGLQEGGAKSNWSDSFSALNNPDVGSFCTEYYSIHCYYYLIALATLDCFTGVDFSFCSPESHELNVKFSGSQLKLAIILILKSSRIFLGLLKGVRFLNLQT